MKITLCCDFYARSNVGTFLTHPVYILLLFGVDSVDRVDRADFETLFEKVNFTLTNFCLVTTNNNSTVTYIVLLIFPRTQNFDRIKTITSDPNEMWLLWRTFFFVVLNKHAPIGSIKVKGNNLPYITAEVRQLTRQRDFLRKKANKTGSIINI